MPDDLKVIQKGSDPAHREIVTKSPQFESGHKDSLGKIRTKEYVYMNKPLIIYPDWYDDLAEFEHAEKGWLKDVRVEVNGKNISFTFYDQIRFVQDLQDEMARIGFWSVRHCFILKKVSKFHIAEAIFKITPSEWLALH